MERFRPTRARRILRWKDVAPHYSGLQKTQTEVLIARGEWPAPHKIAERAVGFYEDEVAACQAWRHAKSAGETTLSWPEWQREQARDDYEA